MTYLVGPDGNKVYYNGDFTQTVQPGCPIITDARPSWRRAQTGTYSSDCNITGGALDRIDSGDERDQYRIDAEWLLGDHRLRAGIDIDDYTSVAGQALEGGFQWRYSTVNPDGIADSGDEYDIVRQQITSQGSEVQVKQQAYYIEDYWNITPNFIAYGGLRWDTFENINGQGDTYVKISNQFNPRLGFSWDVNGDSSFKVFGNAGRYALPLTPSVAVRGASASLFTRQNFDFTEVDPATGAPIDPTPRGPLGYINAETGHPHVAETVAAKNLDPQYQDEYILGFQAQVTDNASLGVRGIYRELKAAIDDNCDYTAVLNSPGSGFTFDDDEGWWFDGQGNAANLPNEGFPYCRMFNPGKDAVFVTDFLGNGQLTEVTVPGNLLSPKAKRTYSAIEFFFDAKWDKLFLQGSYTYAASKGNTEGGVKSDIGQNDTNVTQDFDYLELTTDTYGYLPNDRRHSLKLFGNYAFSEQWALGFNVLVQSGRPVNCLGVLDLDPETPEYDADGNLVDLHYAYHPYGSSFMRCGTTTAGAVDDSTVVAVPRGTKGRLPWTKQLDLSLAYRPDWAKGLQLKVDVFNVFNEQKVASVIEGAEDAPSGAPSANYLLPASYQTPRSVRFMVQYDF
ncbi:MAG: TonB-dependent receptor [Pseudoxanthomonas sp.]